LSHQTGSSGVTSHSYDLNLCAISGLCTKHESYGSIYLGDLVAVSAGCLNGSLAPFTLIYRSWPCSSSEASSRKPSLEPSRGSPEMCLTFHHIFSISRAGPRDETMEGRPRRRRKSEPGTSWTLVSSISSTLFCLFGKTVGAYWELGRMQNGSLAQRSPRLQQDNASAERNG